MTQDTLTCQIVVHIFKDHVNASFAAVVVAGWTTEGTQAGAQIVDLHREAGSKDVPLDVTISLSLTMFS